MKTLRLRIESTPAVSRVQRFTQFPVRIGRDTTCECRIELAFASRVHARLDVQQGRLVLRDEGSRAGTFLPGPRSVLPNTWVDLAEVGNEFSIGPIRFRAELEDSEPTRGVRLEFQAEDDIDSSEFETARPAASGDVSGLLEGLTSGDPNQTSHYGEAVDPRELEASALHASLIEALTYHRRAARALATLLAQASTRPLGRQRGIAQVILETDEQWDAQSPIRSFLQKTGLRPLELGNEETALRTLQDLAAYYVPFAPPLENAETIHAFASRLTRVIATLADSAATVHAAHFSETEGVHSVGPRTLAGRLLDWTAGDAAIDELVGQTLDVVTHHRHLVQDTLDAIDRALATLRPSLIAQEVRGKWTLVPFRRRWEEYERRFDALVRDRAKPLGPALVSVAKALGLLAPTPAPSVEELPTAQLCLTAA